MYTRRFVKSKTTWLSTQAPFTRLNKITGMEQSIETLASAIGKIKLGAEAVPRTWAMSVAGRNWHASGEEPSAEGRSHRRHGRKEDAESPRRWWRRMHDENRRQHSICLVLYVSVREVYLRRRSNTTTSTDGSPSVE
jgi:hypothetical protein